MNLLKGTNTTNSVLIYGSLIELYNKLNLFGSNF